jgi:hypothetical protein
MLVGIPIRKLFYHVHVLLCNKYTPPGWAQQDPPWLAHYSHFCALPLPPLKFTFHKKNNITQNSASSKNLTPSPSHDIIK